MTPTLVGRIATRWFLLLFVGVPWTLVIAPVLAAWVDAPASEVYETAFLAVGVVAVVGIVWELIYHGLQQYRWEKDWPALFGLLNGVNEFVSTGLILEAAGRSADRAYIAHFVSLWLLVWFVANGPFRVVFLRWRFRGGRIA